jgi:pimeloyl-ACP methyl ester carboxylesterase
MSKLRIRARLRQAVDTVTHGYDYARHWAHGNRVPAEMSWVKPGAPPVVLVHGFLGTRGTMVPMTRRLRADGRVVFSYGHGTFQLASLRRTAQELAGHLRALCEELGVEHVDIVGFSMGGLVALHAVKFLSGKKYVRRIVTLGAPFGGTWVGLAGVATVGGVSPSVWQVLPNSKFLRELADAPLPDGVTVRQVHAAGDAFCPAPGPIEGVKAGDYVILPGGHSSLVVADNFYGAIDDFLERPDPAYAGEAMQAAE